MIIEWGFIGRGKPVGLGMSDLFAQRRLVIVEKQGLYIRYNIKVIKNFIDKASESCYNKLSR